MVDKKKSSRSNKKSRKSDPLESDDTQIEAKTTEATATDSSDETVEEVEAEIVKTATQPTETQLDETQTTETLAAMGDDLSEADESTLETDGDSGITSPGILFLSVLGLVGAIGAGMWAFGQKEPTTINTGNTGAQKEIAATSSETKSKTKIASKTDPLDQSLTQGQNNPKVAKPGNPVSAQPTKELPLPTASNKITNQVSGETKTTIASLDTATLSQDKINTLPAAPNAIGGANNKLQTAAKAAANDLKIAAQDAPLAEVATNTIDDQSAKTINEQVVAGTSSELTNPPVEGAKAEATSKASEIVEGVSNSVSEKVTVPSAATTNELTIPANDPIAAVEALQQESLAQYEAADTQNVAQETVAQQGIPGGEINEEAVQVGDATLALTANATTAPGSSPTLPNQALANEPNVNSATPSTGKTLSLTPAAALAPAPTEDSVKAPANPLEAELAPADSPQENQQTSAAAPTTAIAAAPQNNQSAVKQVEEKFAGEIAALEENFEERTTRIANDLKTEQARAETQAQEIASLTTKLEEALAANEQRSSKEITELRARIDELKKEDEQKSVTSERRTAGLLALISLQRTFDQGTAYRRELDVLQSALPEKAYFSALDRAADTGAPTMENLKERFPEAVHTTLALDGPSAKGPVGHFMRNLRSLVSVRPVTPQEGTSAKAIISRAENHLSRDNLKDSIKEISSLGSATSEEMNAWLRDAKIQHEASEQLLKINEGLLAGINN